MKISLSYWMFPEGLEGNEPIESAMQQTKDLGFDAIELCVATTGLLTDKTTQTQCEDIRAAADKIGIEISSVASGESWNSSPTANDPAVRKNIIQFTQQAIRLTKWLGTDAYLFVPGAVEVFFLPDAEIIPYETCYQRAHQAVTQILPVAEENQVALSIENVWNKFLLSPLEMRDFIDEFNSPYIGSYFDVGNVLLTGYPQDWIRILGPRVKRVHIKDFDKNIGTIEGFGELLQGSVDFDAVKQALADINYNGYVTAEILPYATGRLEKTAHAMKKIFNK
ncbi:MAG: sugar phosphate isomerase/epimerase [Sedimentisphaerales bacterium]|nr:sugar phosphate isomerase/epimerase [Sedimentisphaerales bacterium]